MYGMSQGAARLLEAVDLAAERNVDEWGCALFARVGAGECGVWGHPACALSRFGTRVSPWVLCCERRT